MAENQVNVLVQIITKGQEALKQVESDLDKLTGKQAAGAKTTDKANVSSNLLNTSLSKQYPILRNLQPLVGAMNLGWLTGAGAIAAIGMGAAQANQAFETWMAGMMGLAVATNTLTGGQSSLATTIASAAENAKKLGISTNDYADALSKLDSVTRNANTSLPILNDAVSISHATGLPLSQVVNELAAAYDGTLKVFDKTGAIVPPGVEALKTLEDQLYALDDAHQGLKRTVDDAWNSMTTTISSSLGSMASDIGTGFKKILVDYMDELNNTHGAVLAFFGPGGVLLDLFTGFSDKIREAKIWDGIGSWWSDTWRGIWSNIQNSWAGVQSFFTGNLGVINAGAIFGKISEWWSNLWPGIRATIESSWNSFTTWIGSTWSDMWRGAGNIAITAINWLISQLNKISWDIPDWIPLIGGKHFGFNITEIPMLAKGTDYFQGGPAIVGERGPELVNLPRGASVTPMNGGPVTIHLHVGDELLASYVINRLEDTVRIRGGI